MNAVVFCGPTISAEEVRREFDVICLPPVAQGDVYRAALDRPAMIGIIDGYFRQVPSVWHKEILWAMARGIAVFGSASMGALRAAELAAFGMIGVGSIFDDYVSGKLEDDDEVAVAHAAAEHGYRAVSEPMVNIRYTLEKAASAGIIDAEACAALIVCMKEIPYPLRSFEYLLEEAAPHHLCSAEREALRAWLPIGRIDQKRVDARLMLRAMQQRWEFREPLPAVQFHFNHTVAWQNMISDARTVRPSRGDETVATELLLEELYLYRGNPKGTIAGASGRHLALEDARRAGHNLSDDFVVSEESNFRRTRGLANDQDFAGWLHANDLSRSRFREFLVEECLLALTKYRPALSAVPNYLRSTGLYPALAERAIHKQEVLIASGFETPRLEDTGLQADALLEWYLDRVPRDSDSYSALLTLAHHDVAVLLRAAIREYIYTEQCRAATLPSRDRQGAPNWPGP
jgi:hypothetical protein